MEENEQEEYLAEEEKTEEKTEEVTGGEETGNAA